MKWVVSAILILSLAVVWGCSNTSESPSGTTDVPSPSDSENPYELTISSPSAKVGQEARAEIVVTPRSGFKINMEYPAKLSLSTIPEGTTAPQSILKNQMSIEKTRLLVPVAFTSEGAGEKRFEGELRFSVCNEQSCQMPRETVTWTTNIEAAQ